MIANKKIQITQKSKEVQKSQSDRITWWIRYNLRIDDANHYGDYLVYHAETVSY